MERIIEARPKGLPEERVANRELGNDGTKKGDRDVSSNDTVPLRETNINTQNMTQVLNPNIRAGSESIGEPRLDIDRFDILQAKFSLYGAGIRSKESQHPYRQDASLYDVCAWMKSERMKSLTQELRSIEDEKQQRTFKSGKLPFATFSGQFSYRNADGLIQHSGLQCFDIDHLEGVDAVQQVRQLLQQDEYFTTELMFTSPRGYGVKWITHIDLSRGTHEQWYEAITEHLRRRYGIVVDSSPSNVASACFLCYDANLIINPKVISS